MQAARAGLDERARGLERVVGVDGLVVEVALAQAHGLAVADVDRRQEDHAATERTQLRTKFPSSAQPVRRRTSRGGTGRRRPGGRATALTNSPP